MQCSFAGGALGRTGANGGTCNDLAPHFATGQSFTVPQVNVQCFFAGGALERVGASEVTCNDLAPHLATVQDFTDHR